jgi:hypothetical protein
MKRTTPVQQDPAQPSESGRSAGKKNKNTNKNDGNNKNKNGGNAKKGDNGADGKKTTVPASGNTAARRMTPKRHCTSLPSFGRGYS